MKKNTKTNPRFPDRVRFNWGYHDGVQWAKNPHWTRLWTKGHHCDPVYERGYWIGFEDCQNGTNKELSCEAWVRAGGKPDPWYKPAEAQ